MPIKVDADTVVVVDGVNIDVDEHVTFNGIETERAQDHIVEFQDPDKAHKTIVCHKNKLTISVGTPAAQKGHFGHGDSLGACQDIAQKDPDDDSDDDDSDDDEEKKKA